MAPLELKGMEIGMVPGTGRMSLALASHFSKAGLKVLLGSRDATKAARAAATLASPFVHGLSNEEVASRADLLIWSPRGSIEERESMLRGLACHMEGKIIVDVSNIGYAMEEREWGQTSSTLRNQAALGVPARWTTAFKATFASKAARASMGQLCKVHSLLTHPIFRVLENAKHGGRLEGTIICGDDTEAVDTTIALVEMVPSFVGIRGGGLKNTKIVELLGPPWLIELDELNGHSSHASGWHYGI